MWNADRGFLRASFGPTCDGEAGHERCSRLADHGDELGRVLDAETDAAIGLVKAPPVTVHGAVALLGYLTYRAEKGYAWPEDPFDDEQRNWEYYFHRNLTKLLNPLQ
jgi:hypothetical protein